MAQRIFTVAGRNGTAIITDSKLNKNGNGTYDTFKGEDTQLESLKALNSILSIVPVGVKFDTPVTFLLPNFISFLNYEDTRTFWLENKKTKGGKEVSPELLQQVRIMHDLLNKLGSNVRLFGQKGIKSATFNGYIRSSWRIMDSIIAPPETVDASKAF
ncbi:hypothetical protein [Paraclostridium dentum]|uniref:hypothetical protein n=1 Tax=Paraclostridium dentum TaxID=2662455 RepID=UPI003F3A8FE0